MADSFQFKFEHTGDVRVIKDVRPDVAAQPRWAHCYFVAFKIKRVSGECYHHALIIADSFEVFMRELQKVSRSLIDYIKVKSKQDVTLIFMQNLVSLETDDKNLEQRCEFAMHHAVRLIREHGGNFVVTGLSDSGQLVLMESDAIEGLQALDDTNLVVLEKFNETFTPHLICLAQPIASEFFTLLKVAIERFGDLVGHPVGTSMTVH